MQKEESNDICALSRASARARVISIFNIWFSIVLLSIEIHIHIKYFYDLPNMIAQIAYLIAAAAHRWKKLRRRQRRQRKKWCARGKNWRSVRNSQWRKFGQQQHIRYSDNVTHSPSWIMYTRNHFFLVSRSFVHSVLSLFSSPSHLFNPKLDCECVSVCMRSARQQRQQSAARNVGQTTCAPDHMQCFGHFHSAIAFIYNWSHFRRWRGERVCGMHVRCVCMFWVNVK